MGRRAGMTLDQRNVAIGMLTAGSSVRDVARHFGFSERTIHRLKTRFRQTGSVSDLPRSGRPKVTTARQDRYLVTSSRRNRFLTRRQLRDRLRRVDGTHVSVQTVQNRLHASGLRGRRPYVGIPLTRRHRQLRRQWATAHLPWTRQMWNRILFTDESRFNVAFADGRLRVWRRRGERFDPENVVERDRYGGGSVMIWGGISYQGKTELVTVNGTLNSVRYCNEIIRPVVHPYIRDRHADTLQQDNARPHVARYTRDTLGQLNIPTLDWPARSPDLSPIEQLWDDLGRRVREGHDVNNVRELEAALHEEWRRTSLRVIRTLINSMRSRCLAVREKNGGHTRY